MPTKKPRNPDHVRRRNTPQADNKAITDHLQDLLSSAIYAQSAYYRSLGLRWNVVPAQRAIANSQPNIDGRCGVNSDLATSTIALVNSPEC